MECSNDTPKIRFEDKNFVENCKIYFSEKKGFLVICDNEKKERCRKAVDMFLRFQSPFSTRWERVKTAFQAWWVGIPVVSITVVCNEALLRDWDIKVQHDENQVFYAYPKFDVNSFKL